MKTQAIPLAHQNRVAASWLIDELEPMGAKYLPTDKDQKLTARYQQKLLTQSKFIKPANPPSAPKKAKKR